MGVWDQYAETWPEVEPGFAPPSFVRVHSFDEWQPVCECGRLYVPHSTSMTNYACNNYDAHGSFGRLALIFGDEWPDYCDEEDE